MDLYNLTLSNHTQARYESIVYDLKTLRDSVKNCCVLVETKDGGGFLPIALVLLLNDEELCGATDSLCEQSQHIVEQKNN